jgi:hypothetical protein
MNIFFSFHALENFEERESHLKLGCTAYSTVDMTVINFSGRVFEASAWQLKI